jgi:hypothetical protein
MGKSNPMKRGAHYQRGCETFALRHSTVA